MESMKNAHHEAEMWLYKYSALKRKDALTRAEMLSDAVWPSTASTESAGVKTSGISDPTGRGGLRLATAEYETLSEEERTWMLAIDLAETDMENYAPEILKMMRIVYGTAKDDWRPRTKERKAEWRVKAMMECGIERENTYYEWRMKILEMVICCRMRVLERMLKCK